MKTVGVGLIMALNVGTDPPDVVKPHPCAKLQCWMDPSSVTRAKAKEKIGERLEKQYARWQQQRGGGSSSSSSSSSSRPFKYRKTLDPTVEDVRALCLWLRKQARTERILLHYNGHGVPRPTPNGEIWVFDKNHTEYIPLSVSDLRQWVGKPTIVILDCSSAGILIPFLTAPPAETPTNTPPRMPSPILNGINGAAATSATDDDPIINNMDEAASHWVKDTIVLCPTSEGEWLPMSPEYPADIFTACLTTPIQMALRWFVRNNRISMDILFNEENSNSPGNDGPDIWVDSIPGQANDRKTPLGELNWIFTSVTDSIAWNVLPKPLFQRLFRQDLLVASMFRNFLLADRILRNLNCTPQSYPPLPPGVADHPLWQAWDLACETCLFGLIKDGILGGGPTAGLSDNSNSPDRMPSRKQQQQQQQQPLQPQQMGIPKPPPTTTKISSISSPFFSEQLTGFEVWLEYASIHKGNNEHLQPPEQLPVVLQVLLSQAHRVRALELLRRFLALGPWAVNLALSLGIFPYVGKLLQSSEYKTVLVHIWASILKFDPSCQVDLSKDKSLKHFIQPLAQFSERTGDSSASQHNTPEAAKQRTLNAFCLASLCYKYPNAQNECLRQNLHSSCAALLDAQIKLQVQQKEQMKEQEQVSRRASRDATQFMLLPPIAREWICMCLGNLVQAFHLAQAQAYEIEVHDLLIELQQDDDDPNVRAAATYALGNLFEHASLPSTNNQSTSTLSSSSSRTRLQSKNPPPLSTMAPPSIGTPNPIRNPIGMMASNVPPSPPVGMPIVGSPLGIGASAVGSPIMMKQMRVAPHLVEQQQRRRPTVYEDLRRILFDLKVMESMIKVLADGSSVVRYEVVMGLSNFVEKYLQAILVIAEDATRVMDTIRLGKISEDEEGDAGTSHSRANRSRVVSLPKGVNQKLMERFEQCWRALRKIQHEDPHPNVSGTANKIVRVVHETLYDMRMELDAKKDRSKIDNGLSGIQEEGETGGEGMDRVKSDVNISLASPDQIASEAGGGNFPSVKNGDAKSLPSLAMPGRNLMDRVKAENLLPKSQLYTWKKSIFKPDFDDEDVEDHDPLNPLEAARNYQNRRNNIVREAGNKLAKHFEGLNPRTGRKSRQAGLDALVDENDDANEDSDIFLQNDLRLKEKRLLRNSGGVKMTSMLKFHSYENALVVCDNQDYVSVWDYEEGTQKASFKNGNPAGSRMTSTFWINESSSSLLFVGCDDGSARIWRGAVQNNGQISSSAPTLESSFFAIPNMEAGQRSKSGLICEWQQTTGTLIAGGNSRHLRCWDMMAEKCSTTIDIESESCITTLATAWDEDHHDIIQKHGFRGNGPEIIVAGFSDGTLKLFDIRMPKSAAALSAAARTNDSNKRRGKAANGGRRRGTALHNRTFNEHGSWIVDVTFTSYGGNSQNEILSGSVAGDIRAWDIRTPSRSLRDIEVQRSPMTALSVHKKIPVVATGSHAQFIKILTLEGETLQVARFHEESLPGHRIGPVSCLEFHKQKLVLAAGSTNALVSVYQPRKPRS
eukprot:jgi/Psemu1/246784/estExt_Genewise1.C_8680002